MNYNLEQAEEKLNQQLTYVNSVAACWDANCSLDDPEVDDVYIRHRLKQALYGMSEFLIVRCGVTPPQELRYRLYRVRDLYGSSFVPYMCFRIAEEDTCYRDELAVIAQAVDDWFSTSCRRLGNVTNDMRLYAMVG